MTTIIPTPAPVPDPLSSDFGTKAYDFTVWMAAAAPAMTAVAQETNDALNQSLLGMVSTTTSSITIAAPGGTVNFTTQANKGYAIGMTLRIASTANPANYVKVRLTAYNISTGVSAGTIIGSGGSGTYTSWSVFFDTDDPSILTVPTGETVAAGNLIAMDDAGLSMSVAPITPAVLQAVAATSLHACPLANGNTAIFWTAGTTDYRMMVVGSGGGTVLASTSVATAVSSGLVWSSELTNANIVLVYFNSSSYPCFKVLSAAGATVVAETVITANAVVTGSQIKCCALTGGGFAVGYSINGVSPRFSIYSNAGAVVTATVSLGSSGHTKIAMCPTAAGGLVILTGITSLTGGIYDSVGTLVTTCALGASSSSSDVNIASKSGAVAATSYSTDVGYYSPELSLAVDDANASIGSASPSGNSGFIPKFYDLLPKLSGLANGHIAVLTNGNFIATFSPKNNSTEFARFIIFNERGLVIDSGIVSVNAVAWISPVFVLPKDVNGFSIIWSNIINGNIMFAQVKSGKLLGISLGQVGSTTQYKTSGEVNVYSNNMLNVGEASVSYSRKGFRVVM